MPEPSVQGLDPATLPLAGSRLIEASAGTGKTWTIAALVLRLVLGHGGAGAFHRPLQPAEILVMTFTRAATRELSDRLRRRLAEAARVFRGEAQPEPGDDFLATLLADHPAGPAREQAAWRLAAAASGMDDAAVFTIDAWCQRMLREHAFDSGASFDESLAPQTGSLLDDAVRDHWRAEVYPLEGEALARLLREWATPDALREALRPLLGEAALPPPPPGTLGGLLARRLELARAAKAGWAGRFEAMRGWLQSAYAARRLGSAVQPRWANGWLDRLVAWSTDPLADWPSTLADQRLTPAGLRDCAKGELPPLPPEFEAFDRLRQEVASWPPLGPALRLHAAHGVAARLDALQRRARVFGFADLLRRLDAALDPAAGASAERLRARIVAQYPVALVDEFQDTSPVQYRILDRLYRTAAHDAGLGLLLIGDPKQSIYRFRGADIHSYLAAREATAGRHHVLGTNHRSTGALVRAVNHVFRRAEQRPGAGAFRFRSLGADPLPFVEVEPRGRPEVFQCGGEPVPALTLVVDPAPAEAEAAMRTFAERAAEQVVAWLGDASCGLRDAAGGWQRLRPADVALLVRSGHQARALRAALGRRQVASVYLSDGDAVMASDEAADLLRWLQAVAAPRDVRRARAAWATATVGLPLAEVARTAHDEAAFDERAALLAELHATWARHGVLTMLRRSLHALELPARLLARADGERALTNLLHLSELLQEASAARAGEQALVRWFAEQVDLARADPRAADDEQVLRLESDADRVRIVTVHKSKGLEYPVVLLPFAEHARAAGREDAHWLPGAAGQPRRFVAEPGDEDRREADEERLREDLRLLYVALTRARHAVWVGASAVEGRRPALGRTALGWLLGAEERHTAADLLPLCRALAEDRPEIALVLAAPVARRTLPPGPPPPPLPEAVPYRGRIDRGWGVASFTALTRPGTAAAPRLPAPGRRDDEPAEAGGGTGPAGGDEPWHRFPRGPAAGNFLHEQLEWLSAEGALAQLHAAPELQRELRQRAERQGQGAHGDGLLAWFVRLAATRLPPLGGATLGELVGRGALLPEMEFWLPGRAIDAARIDAACRAHLLPGRPREPLPARTLDGLLMGFADLVFEHGGRWWVLDHKSNALGARDGDYTDEALARAVAGHRYDVQAGVYLLALHRLLASRLGAAYDPARQLGGAVFLFLRGLAGPAAGCATLAATPALLHELDEALGGRGEAPT